MDVFELVHCDIWGPYRTTSTNGSRYFLTIVDDFSRSLWLYLLPNKTTAPTRLKDFIALVERQFEKKVKTIRSDNGSEFICLRNYFQQTGIIHETSCVGTPQQNGRVERKHRHILNVARALRFQACLPIEMWDECVLAAGYLINRTPSSVLGGKTPFELLYKRPPPLNHLRVFGCLCYVHNQQHNGDKFATRSKKSVFIGYPNGKKGWRVYDLETGNVSISRDVIFCEKEFPFAASKHDLEASTSTPPLSLNQFVVEPEILISKSHVSSFLEPELPLTLDSAVNAPVTEQTSPPHNEHAESDKEVSPLRSPETKTNSADLRPDDSAVSSTNSDKSLSDEDKISQPKPSSPEISDIDISDAEISFSEEDTEPEAEELGVGKRKK
ncbi:Retrovirus-related Pol polyprotein from transposon RE2 [Cardamine amara subsp. amara]|uniref:Retrovirus-related Pol polyprotein from transposon RE2 n=1 Tax=Cardamine amara subsp. amara TaxID=228776 RepID=A0ABD0Z956_CARAN